MAEDEEKPVKKKSKLKWIILFLLLILGGGAAAAWFFVFDQKIPPFLQSEEQRQEEAAPKSAIPDPTIALGNIIPLREFWINLADPLGRKIIKLSLSVEVANPSVIDELRMLEPKLRDAIIMLVSSKTYADLASSEGKINLKTEITNRINQVLGGPKVIQTLYTDIAIP